MNEEMEINKAFKHYLNEMEYEFDEHFDSYLECCRSTFPDLTESVRLIRMIWFVEAKLDHKYVQKFVGKSLEEFYVFTQQKSEMIMRKITEYGSKLKV